jgi:CcmD family protein
MKSSILVITIVAAAASAALAQPGSGAGSAAGSGSALAAPPEPTAAPVPPPPPTPAELRKACTAAMNADPALANDIIKQAKEMNCTDATMLKVHQDAQVQIQKNETHVILAYAAMWVIAAAFVLFLWRRQQALKSEILQLKRDLEGATKDGK